MQRRTFVKNSALAGSVMATNYPLRFANEERTIACQQYPWHTYLERDGSTWMADLDKSMLHVAEAGFTAFEPLVESKPYLQKIFPLIQDKFTCHSIYVNSILHDQAQVDQSSAEVIEICELAADLGTKIVVTNPAPIRWGGPGDKSDDELKVQAQSLNQLGEKLRKMGMTLAYHNHDPEMRNAAREFHHMMRATDPENVKLCLDAHWIYRGAGDSHIALNDIVDMYLDRIVELHLRQSDGGVWSEVFSEGDIDYVGLHQILTEKAMRPHLVLEQAVEEGSPETMSGVDAHRIGLEYATTVFG